VNWLVVENFMDAQGKKGYAWLKSPLCRYEKNTGPRPEQFIAALFQTVRCWHLWAHIIAGPVWTDKEKTGYNAGKAGLRACTGQLGN